MITKDSETTLAEKSYTKLPKASSKKDEAYPSAPSKVIRRMASYLRA